MKISLRNRVIASSIALGGGIALATQAYTASAAPDPMSLALRADGVQVPSVKSTFERAMQARASVTVPNSGRGQSVPLDRDAKQRALSAGTAALSAVFTSTAAAHELVGLRNAAAAEASGDLLMKAAGISKVEYLQVAVSNKTATVHADVTAWSRFQIRQTNQGPWMSAQPTNVALHR